MFIALAIGGTMARAIVPQCQCVHDRCHVHINQTTNMSQIQLPVSVGAHFSLCCFLSEAEH